MKPSSGGASFETNKDEVAIDAAADGYAGIIYNITAALNRLHPRGAEQTIGVEG